MRDIFEIRAKKERKGYRFELFGGGVVVGGGVLADIKSLMLNV